MDAIRMALGGMNTAVARFDRASTDLVGSMSGASSVSPEQAVVQSIEAEIGFKASASVMRAADEMMGSLLDIRV